VEKLRKLYEGKAKILYETTDPDLLIQHFKDDATAFNAAKKGTILQKGILNNQISTRVFEHLEGQGIPTHYVRSLSDREMLVRRLEIVLIEVVVRNTVAGSLAKRLGLEEGTPLPNPILEFYYKSDALGDPMINDDHIRFLGLASAAEVQAIRDQAVKINATLLPFFAQRDILLVDFKVEFGRHHGALLLGDEITPDGCRLWDRATREKMDKDRFRRDLGRVEEAYQEVHRRVCGA
jgi:phosphoribosylaminoimidazole-succinocarboxamide synthase